MTSADTDELTGGHVMANRAYWNDRASDWVAAGERAWSAPEPYWGIWSVANSDLGLLPADMGGVRAVELGCGTGYVSGWMARLGASVTGIDISEEQLATARRLAAAHGAETEFVLGSAEATPFPDAAFDFAISEYGAAIWCDPYVWLPEAHRILKPGGLLRFLGNHPFVPAFTPLDGSALVRELQRPYFGAHRFDWSDAAQDPGGIEFNLTFEAWIELFLSTGFVVEGFKEPRPAAGVSETRFFVSGEWAASWPSEHVWFLRKEGR